MWQWFKSKIAMKIYDLIDVLEEKLTQLIKELDKQTIKQITA